MQVATASFVLNHFTTDNKVIHLEWLPLPERREYRFLQLAHKALCSSQWPVYLPLLRYIPATTSRASETIQMTVPSTTATFQQTCDKLFNSFPKIQELYRHKSIFKTILSSAAKV